MRERAVAFRSDGLTDEQIAQRLRVESEGEARISKDAVAALIRRQIAEPREPAEPQGLSSRMVRDVHTILHSALEDALRRDRSHETSPTPPLPRRLLPPDLTGASASGAAMSISTTRPRSSSGR